MGLCQIDMPIMGQEDEGYEPEDPIKPAVREQRYNSLEMENAAGHGRHDMLLVSVQIELGASGEVFEKLLGKGAADKRVQLLGKTGELIEIDG